MNDDPRPIRPLGVVRLSLTRPVAVGMMFVGILAMGIVTYLKLPLQLLPDEGFSGSSITIMVPYPSASPREIEEGIVRPIEEAIGRIPGVSDVYATARVDAAQVRVVFHSKTDVNLAQADLKEQLDRIKGTFPAGADRYFLFKFDMDSALPILLTGILIDPSVDDVQRRMDEIVRPRIERIDGVARIDVFGLQERHVLIEIDRDIVSALEIPLYSVIQRLSDENRTLSCGEIEDGGRRFLVRAMGEFETLEQLERFPIRPGLALADVATIRFAEDERETITRVNRKPAAILFANKESAANTVAVCEELDRVIEGFADDPALAGLQFHSYFNQGKFIIESLGVLKQTAVFGGALALLVLFLFMKRAAMTVTVALAIPLSILIAVVSIFFTGGTMNVFSMMGLTLGIGMLVDNSIVVAENIDRLRREGRAMSLAALLGPSQVGLAILMSTATTAVVFVPMIFLGEDSNTRVMLQEIGMPVIYSLAGSLVVALTFVPLAIKLLAGKMRPDAEDSTPRWRRPWFLEANRRLYTRLLPWVLKHRLATLVFFVLPFLFSTGIAMKQVAKTADLGGSNQVRIGIDFANNLTLDDADRLMQEYERILDREKGSLGFDFFAAQFSRTNGSIDLFLERDAPYTIKELTPKLRDLLPETAGTRIQLGNDGDNGGQKLLTVQIAGPDSNVLAELSEELTARLESVEGLDEVRSALDEDAGTEEIRIGLQRDLSRQFGINPQEILGLVSYNLRGAQLPDFDSGSETYEAWVRFAERDRAGLEALENVRVPTADGSSIALSTLASFERGRGYRTIRRVNRRTVIEVTARYAEDDQALVTQRLRGALANLALPRGYSIVESGGFAEFEETFRDMSLALLLGVLFVLLLMGILFESFILPLSVLFAIPFAIVGGLWSLVVTGTPLDGVAMVGFVVLAGVVVNNAIVLVDTMHRYRREGVDRTDAIVEAASHRFRPIWMTALTTILGLLPMALSEGAAESVSYLTMARAVIGGLFVATAFTLFVVPLFYTMFDDFRVFAFRFFVSTSFGNFAKGDPAGTTAAVAPVPTSSSGSS